MKGDFSRVSYDVTRHIRRVLTQQGRVQLDSDANEQTAALLHIVESMMADLVGPYAVPQQEVDGRNGFLVQAVGHFDLTISPGHCWVGGMLCEIEGDVPVGYSAQPDYPVAKPSQPGTFAMYLDVWERHLSVDEAPWTREAALGQADTSTRAKLVWQAKLIDFPDADGSAAGLRKNFSSLVARQQPANRGRLSAQAEAPIGNLDPCVMPPDSRYRGPENQLYRVEVHDPGVAGTATFKWSRDNGSVVAPVHQIDGTEVTVEHFPPRFSVEPGLDWIEVIDDTMTLLGTPGRLVQVASVELDENTVTVVSPGSLPTYGPSGSAHPMLRRWDQQGPAVTIEEERWLDLEDGVRVRFAQAPTNGLAHQYRTGDYWLIPARVATGDVIWPVDELGNPAAVPPDGVEHHYAPLAMVVFNTAGGTIVEDARRRIAKIWEEI